MTPTIDRPTPERKDSCAEGHVRLRDLGAYERFRVILHDLGFHLSVSLAGFYAAPPHTRDREVQNAVLTSLNLAIRQHPNLGLQVRSHHHNEERLKQKNNQEMYYFIRLPSIVLTDPRVVTFRDFFNANSQGNAQGQHPALLESLLQAESNKGFHHPNQPLWRLLVLNLGTPSTGESPESGNLYALLFTWHHVIADGKSGLAFHSTLLQGLNFYFASPDTASLAVQSAPVGGLEVIQPCQKAPMPAMEDILSYNRSWRALFNTWSSFIPSWLFQSQHHPRSSRNGSETTRKWTGGNYALPLPSTSATTATPTSTTVSTTISTTASPPQPQLPPQTQVRLIVVTKATTQSLQRLCRHHQTSITAFLQVAIARVLFSIYKDYDVMRCATALSIRRFLDPKLGIGRDGDMGLWIDAFASDIWKEDVKQSEAKEDEQRFWASCRHKKDLISHEINKGDCDLGFRSLHGTPRDFAQELLSVEGKERKNSYSVTNLGLFVPPTTQTIGEMVERHTMGPSRGAQAMQESPREQEVGGHWDINTLILSQSAHVNGSALQFCIASAEGGMSISIGWQRGIVAEEDVGMIVSRLANFMEGVASGKKVNTC